MIFSERTWAFKPATVIKFRLTPGGAAVGVGLVLIVFPHRCGLGNLRSGGRQVVFAGRSSARRATRRCAAHPVAPLALLEIVVDPCQRVPGPVRRRRPFTAVIVINSGHDHAVFIV